MASSVFDKVDSDVSPALLPLASQQPVNVSANGLVALKDILNNGTVVDAAVRSKLNLIAGSGIALTIADNPGADRVDVTVAAGAGALVSHTEVTAPVNITATTEGTAQTFITAPAFTFDGATKYDFEFFCPEAQTAGGAALRAVLFEDGAAIGWLSETYPASGTVSTPVLARRSRVPAAGSHTYSIRGFNSATATLTFQAGAAGAGILVPAYLRITRAPT